MYIYTTNRQVKKPEPITRDSRGTLIEPGLRVAFNHSGDVIIGTIVSVKSDWKEETYRGKFEEWKFVFALKIENEYGSISTVHNPNSFVII